MAESLEITIIMRITIIIIIIIIKILIIIITADSDSLHFAVDPAAFNSGSFTLWW